MAPTRILVLSYSQTGQLTRLARAIAGPLAAHPGAVVDWHEIVPRTTYPFPWTFLSFLDVFPESVYLDPPQVDVPGLDPSAEYDLVLLAYQVWFLSPSLPVTGFLRSPLARVLRGRRVVTIVGCRNMWVSAHRAMQGLLAGVGARQVDNVVLTDEAPLWSTFVTTPWWMLTGDKGPLFGRLPEAGLRQADIDASARFGRALVDALPAIAGGSDGPFLQGLRAVRVDPRLMLGERIGRRSFGIWGRLLRAVGRAGDRRRRPVLIVYVVFLIGAIIALLPLTMLVNTLVARFSPRVRAAAAALEAPSGSSGTRMAVFAAPPNCDSL